MNGDDTSKIYEKLDELATTLAGLRATVDISLKQHNQELATLFEKHSEHGRRIAKIEAQYVPNAKLERCQEHSRTEHRDFRGAIEEQRRISGRIGGGIAVVGVVVGAVLVWLLGVL